MSHEGIEIVCCRSLYAASRLPSLTSFCTTVSGVRAGVHICGLSTHQSAHGAVKSMPVVPAELGVGALERRVTVRLGLLDTAVPPCQQCSASHRRGVVTVRVTGVFVGDAIPCVRRASGGAYPFLWFFFDWLCWDEFLDSAQESTAVQRVQVPSQPTGHGDGCVCRIGEEGVSRVVEAAAGVGNFEVP